jgi:hypothetical protein
MNAILEPFKALWKRKLWPVAVLLVAALAAVPMVLAKEPTAAPAPAANAQAKADQGMPATFVTAAEPGEDGERRRVLGRQKDPFAPAELSAKAKAARKKAEAKEKAQERKSSGDTAKQAPADKEKTSDAPSGGGGAAGPSEPPPSTAPAPRTTYPKFSIKVRFGVTEGDALQTRTVERLAVLPNDESPVLVYRGVEDGGKVAVFELTGTVVAVGDGKCEPDPDNCQILKLRAGETEFLTISDTGTEADAQYQLELLRINHKTTTEKTQAEALTKSAGAKLLGKLNRKAAYAFDPQTGTLHKVGKKLSRAARRASL